MVVVGTPETMGTPEGLTERLAVQVVRRPVLPRGTPATRSRPALRISTSRAVVVAAAGLVPLLPRSLRLPVGPEGSPEEAVEAEAARSRCQVRTLVLAGTEQTVLL